MNDRLNLTYNGQYTSLFEEGYLNKTYTRITNRADLAFTELVANTWDSGAEIAKITIPSPNMVLDSYITIEDDGVGMSKDTVNNLFTIKSMVSSHGTKNEAGTGLGLIVVKDFLTKHNCQI